MRNSSEVKVHAKNGQYRFIQRLRELQSQGWEIKSKSNETAILVRKKRPKLWVQVILTLATFGIYLLSSRIPPYRFEDKTISMDADGELLEA